MENEKNLNETKGNEKKGVETKVETKLNETNENEIQVNEETPVVKQLFVERVKNIAKDGREYWNYMTKGKALGRDIRVDFMPKDKGGYEVLDILFSLQDKARLIVGEESSTDVNGKTTKYKTYTLQVVDENDEEKTVYDCSVKPSRDSDKALLNMLLKQKN